MKTSQSLNTCEEVGQLATQPLLHSQYEKVSEQVGVRWCGVGWGKVGGEGRRLQGTTRVQQSNSFWEEVVSQPGDPAAYALQLPA